MLWRKVKEEGAERVRGMGHIKSSTEDTAPVAVHRM